MKKIISSLFAVALLAGCASMDQGLTAYNRGDYRAAEQHWAAAAARGDATAQYNLGMVTENGAGRQAKDPVGAARWYAMSAQNGYVPAMVRLAAIQKQYGDAAAAESWLSLAARWGDQNAVQMLHSWGKPVPQPDLLYAHQRHRSAPAGVMLLEGVVSGAVEGYAENLYPERGLSNRDIIMMESLK